MRAVFCRSLVEAATNPDFVFLTGDLGFMALEPLRDALGARFINAGVAEQNMISVAAGLAKTGLRPWAYSIAPFIYARPYEQIRNDICLHKLPVILVGNGGGFGYGPMGSTHHAIEDYGALLALHGMRACIPAFDGDVPVLVGQLFSATVPTYLRLGLSEQPRNLPVPDYAPWRKLCAGAGIPVVVVGPLVGGILDAARNLDESVRPNLWLLCELPFSHLPDQLLEEMRRSDALLVVEEHGAHGGAGQMIAHHLLSIGRAPRRFVHRFASPHCAGRYGSQKFHRASCGLDPASIVALCTNCEIRA